MLSKDFRNEVNWSLRSIECDRLTETVTGGHFANSRRYYRPIELLHTALQTAIAGHRRTCLDARLRVHDLEVGAAAAAPDDKIPSNSGCANNRTAFSCAMSGTQRSSSDAALIMPATCCAAIPESSGGVSSSRPPPPVKTPNLSVRRPRPGRETPAKSCCQPG